MAKLMTDTLPTGQGGFLSGVMVDPKPRPTAAVFYGPPGVGKTSFAAAFPEPVFLVDDEELGVETLKASGLIGSVPVMPPITNWDDTLGAIRELIEGEHSYKTLVVDTIGGIESFCHSFVCMREFAGDWGEKGFGSYNKGYEVSIPEWRRLIMALDRLRSERAMSVVLLAHSIVKPYHNPDGEDYDRYIPAIHPKTWAVTHRWADMVGFMTYQVTTTEEKGSKSKGTGGRRRVLRMEYRAAYEAKNRHGITGEIDMGKSGKEAADNLFKAIKSAKKG